VEVWVGESFSGVEIYKAKQQNFEKAGSVQVRSTSSKRS
jgi:hypothetical protein